VENGVENTVLERKLTNRQDGSVNFSQIGPEKHKVIAVGRTAGKDKNSST
jgi:hypothetical protein